MASVDSQNNPNDPTNPNNPTSAPNQPAATQSTNQPATSGGAGAVTSTGAGNVTGQVTGTNNPTQPFQNIASYLSANAPQSAALAGQVASSVSNPISQTQSDISNASSGFTNSVNAGYTPQNQNLISSVASDPTTATADPNNVAAFKAQLNDAYTGPTDFTANPSYGNLESEVANAQSLGQAAQTPTGIQTLLQGVEGPTTAGVNDLDTLLLSQDPTNFKTISNAGAAADTTNNNLGNFLTTNTTQNNAAAQAAIAKAAATGTDANAALNTAAGNIATPLASQFQNDVTTTQGYNTQLQTLLNAVDSGDLGNLTADQQKELGVSPTDIKALNEYKQLFPQWTQPITSNYYSGPSVMSLPSNESAVETPQQAAAIAALQELNGGTLPASLSGLSPTAPTTGYTAPTNYGAYDNVGLANAMVNPITSFYNQIPKGTNVTPTVTDVNGLLRLLSTITNTYNPFPTSPTGPTGPILGPPGGDVAR